MPKSPGQSIQCFPLAASAGSNRKRRMVLWLAPALVAVVTATVFLPALNNGFVDWDDEKLLVDNVQYRGLGWTQIRWMFTTFHYGHYQPLSWMTLGLDYLLWGMDPLGYHLTNLILHAANAVLFYFLSLRLLSLVFFAVGTEEKQEVAVRVAAGFTALFFSLHPLRVESVVWVTERRDVLSGFFLLATVLSYFKYTAVSEKESRRRWMGASLTFFGLSLLAKASGMTLPVALLVLDVYPLGRLSGDVRQWFGLRARQIWIEKAPFVLMALAIGIVALLAQSEVGALNTAEKYGIAMRVAQAFYGLAFYLWKTIVPLGLSPLYQIPTLFIPWDWPYLVSGAAVAIITTVLFVSRRRWPAGLATWVCYFLMLAPVLGVAQSGPQLVADRYSYLSCMGWAVLLGASLLYCRWARAEGKVGRKSFIAVTVAAGWVLALLAVATLKQVPVWHDSYTLWKHAVAVSPESSLSQFNFARNLVKRGEFDEAIGHYRQAIENNPFYAEAHLNLGNVLADRGQLAEAIQHYHEALKIKPTYAGAHYNLAMALADRGDLAGAMQHYEDAVRFDPGNANAHNNLGAILLQRGELEQAIDHFRQALDIQPGLAQAEDNLKRALAIRAGSGR